MAESDDPVASMRDEAPKPSSPRASPAKFDRAMVEAKMRSDGWVTTEKARANAAEGERARLRHTVAALKRDKQIHEAATAAAAAREEKAAAALEAAARKAAPSPKARGKRRAKAKAKKAAKAKAKATAKGATPPRRPTPKLAFSQRIPRVLAHRDHTGVRVAGGAAAAHARKKN